MGSLTGPVNAQSKDRKNPTRLTSNEISGSITADNLRDIYYYSFVAGLGEVTITLTLEETNHGVTFISYDLFDEDARQISGKSAQAYLGRTEQVVERIKFDNRRSVLIRIIHPSTGMGRYHIQFNGAVGPGQEKRITDADLTALRSSTRAECLPKQGRLIVKMKDGSKKIIDLSEADEITLVP